ncbi:MAG TPA: biotin--[acetyl-CoA-carboxylase] ligase, partial [Thermopetrobacter sp.]|nr:biotin--[acetyl-CoA-carboxylase] ligase [Thermopetrobacter sp.]
MAGPGRHPAVPVRPMMPPGRLIVHDAIDSTQDEARRLLAAGEAGPVWIMAHAQTAGRGRGGRRWVSPPGNLHLSLLMRPGVEARRWPELSLLAALAAHKALARLCVWAGRDDVRDALRLKWPNDVLLHGRKLAGLVLEGVDDAVIIGWGVNLAHAPPDDAVRWPATALCDTGVTATPEQLFPVLRETFRRWHEVWRDFGFANTRKAWLKRAWGLGERLTMRVGDETLTGTFA